MIKPLAGQFVDRAEKGRQRLARPGRRRDQGVAARGNRGPAAALRGGRIAQRRAETFLDEGVEPGERHAGILSRAWRRSGYRRCAEVLDTVGVSWRDGGAAECLRGGE